MTMKLAASIVRPLIMVLFLTCVVSVFALALTKALAVQPPIVVKMLDAPPSFQPARIIIRVGDAVEWKNIGNEVHHATDDPSLAINRADVATPSGTKPFDSGFLKPGETFTQTFSAPGVYRYTCAVHEMKGMTAEIVVQK
jgi:plastocyanin